PLSSPSFPYPTLFRSTLERIAAVISSVLSPIIAFLTEHWDQLKIALQAAGVVLAAVALAFGVLAALVAGSLTVTIISATLSGVRSEGYTSELPSRWVT